MVGRVVLLLWSRASEALWRREGRYDYWMHVVGLIKVLEQSGIAYDMLSNAKSLDLLHKRGALLILPHYSLLCPEEMDNIGKAVQEGLGLVIVGYQPWAEGKGVAEAVGQALTSKAAFESQSVVIREQSHPVTEHFRAGDVLLYGSEAIPLRPPAKAEVLAAFSDERGEETDHPALLVSNFGRGRIIHFPALLGHVQASFRTATFDHGLLRFGLPGFVTKSAAAGKGDFRILLTSAMEWGAQDQILARTWHFPWPYRTCASFHIHMDHAPDFSEWVPAILDAAAEEKVGMSFYAISNYVNSPAKEAIWKRIVAEGHDLGVHGVSHVRFARLPLALAAKQIRLCAERIEKVTGIKPDLFNAPSADVSEETYLLLERLGYKVGGERNWAFDDLPSFMWLPARSGSDEIDLAQYGRMRLVQLPNMMPMIDAYFFQGMSDDEVFEALAEKFRWYQRVGELFRLQGHPHGVGPGLGAYRRLLRFVKGQEDTWVTKDSQLADWWLARDGLRTEWDYRLEDRVGAVEVEVTNEGGRVVEGACVRLSLPPGTQVAGLEGGYLPMEGTHEIFLCPVPRLERGASFQYQVRFTI